MWTPGVEGLDERFRAPKQSGLGSATLRVCGNSSKGQCLSKAVSGSMLACMASGFVVMCALGSKPHVCCSTSEQARQCPSASFMRHPWRLP